MQFEKIKVVTICGRMKFEDKMIKIALELERKYGWCVLQCVYDFDNTNITQKELKSIKTAHFKRISISDAIYVLNIDGYIGKSTQAEIKFAQQHNKQIYYYEKF